jgi:hypothetical protein
MLSRIAQTTIARAKSPRKHAVDARAACFRGGVTGFRVFGSYRESMAPSVRRNPRLRFGLVYLYDTCRVTASASARSTSCVAAGNASFCLLQKLTVAGSPSRATGT